MNSLRCFGVGDGWPCADRHHSSYLYRLGDTSLLIDCGEPVSRSYKAAGLSYDLVDRILLSHLHFDHLGGFFMLLQSCWLEHRTKPLTVHLPAEGVRPVRALLQAAYLFDELLAFPLKFVPWRAGRPVRIGAVSVTAFPTTHLRGLRRRFRAVHRQPFAAFSFRLETPDCRIVHSADLGAPRDLEPLLERPVDLLVCELAHFRPDDLFAFLQGRPVKRLLLTHLSGELWARAAHVQRAARARLAPMRVEIAREGRPVRIA